MKLTAGHNGKENVKQKEQIKKTVIKAEQTRLLDC